MRNKFKKSGLTETYIDGSGRRRFKGTKQLKSSQVYPALFGREAWGWDIHFNVIMQCIYKKTILIEQSNNHNGNSNVMQVRRLWKEHASKDVTKEPCVDFLDMWNDAKFHGSC